MHIGLISLIIFIMLPAGIAMADHEYDVDHHHGSYSSSFTELEPTYLGREYNYTERKNFRREYFRNRYLHNYPRRRTHQNAAYQNGGTYHDSTRLVNPEIMDSFEYDFPEPITEKRRPSPKIIPKERVTGKYRVLRDKSDLNAQQILQLSGKQCRTILRKNKVKFKTLRSGSSVKYPIRVYSKLGNVRYRQSKNRSTYSIMDCRLAVALIGWSKILRKHGIYEVIYSRTYSPGAIVQRTGRPSGHRWALAIDATKFKSRRYGLIQVKHDWIDRRKGVSPCSRRYRREGTTQKILRSVVCKSAERNLFVVILTPHYNRTHHNHFHIELRPNTYRMVLR